MEAGAVHPAQIGGGVGLQLHLLLVSWRCASLPSTLLITRFWAALFAKRSVSLEVKGLCFPVWSSPSRWWIIRTSLPIA